MGGRLPVQCTASRLVPGNRPPRTSGWPLNYPTQGLFSYALPPVAGTADAGEPLAAALPPATAAACDPSADLTNYFSINWLAPAAS
jgi:hypothetical protein